MSWSVFSRNLQKAVIHVIDWSGACSEMESTAVAAALKESEKGAARSGAEANVAALLECARKEMSASSLRSLWQDAPEFATSSSSQGSQGSQRVYERAQRRMMESLGLYKLVEGYVVGHALMRAAEAGVLHVVRRLRKGLVELRCSVLAPRFLGFALLKAAELGRYETVQELLRTSPSSLAMAGHELAYKAKDEAAAYPFVVVSLTKDWQSTVRAFKSLLPASKYVLDSRESLRLTTPSDHEQSGVQEALLSCFRSYALWRLMIVSGANGHGGVFREFLVKKQDSGWSSSRPSASASSMGYDSPKVMQLTKARRRIDEECTRFVMKVTAKLGRDMLLSEVYRSGEGMAQQPWRCASKAQFGFWEVRMEVPVLLMETEGSYQDKEKKKLMRNYHYIKPIIPQVMKLHVQFKVVINILPDYIELSVGVNHARVTVEHQRWEKSETGHFPTRVSLSVTPLSTTLTSVTMTGSSANTTYKVAAMEHVRMSVHGTLKAAPTAGVSLQAGKSTMAKVEGKPWRMEQLPVHNERGGSYTWVLTNLHGSGFDRLSPMLQETKKSIWQFGKRVPINPLLVLPFGTNGGVNFSGSEFDETLSWRFASQLENSVVQFIVEGQVHTTHITQDTFWETRVVPFEVRLEQKLEPCGDPSGADKKKTTKKKTK